MKSKLCRVYTRESDNFGYRISQEQDIHEASSESIRSLNLSDTRIESNYMRCFIHEGRREIYAKWIWS